MRHLLKTQGRKAVIDDTLSKRPKQNHSTPTFRRTPVIRHQLINKLKECDTFPLTVIHAPAGYGKTTTVAQFQAVGINQSIWISLKSGHKDISTVMLMILRALADRYPDQWSSLFRQLSETEGHSFSHFIQSFVEHASSCVEHDAPLRIVIDDFHHLDKESQEAFNELIDSLPTNVSVFVISRTEPLLNLDTRQLYGECQLINQQDLAFSKSECHEYLSNVMELELSNADIIKVFNLSEGWPCAIQLIGTSIHSGQYQDLLNKPNQKIQHCIGTLFQRLDENTPQKLLSFNRKVAVLPFFNSEVCNLLLNKNDSQHFIDQALQLNLFLVTTEQHEGWYRFHDLYQKHLLQNAEDRPNKQALQSVANYFLEHQEITAAMELLIRNQQMDTAIKVLEEYGFQFYRSGDLSILHSWISQIPEHQRNQRAKLLFFYACCITDHDKPEVAPLFLDRARNLMQKAEDENKIESMGFKDTADLAQTQLAISNFQAFIFRMCGQTKQSSETLQLKLDYAIQHGLKGISRIYMGLGQDQFLEGATTDAIKLLKKAMDVGKYERDVYSVLVSGGYCIQALYMCGKINEVIQLVNSIKAWTVEERLQHLPMVTAIEAGLVEIYREQNRLDDAVNALKSAQDYCESGAPILQNLAFQFCRSSLAIATGDQAELDCAIEALDAILTPYLKNDSVMQFGFPNIEALKAISSFKLGDPTLLLNWKLKARDTLMASEQFIHEREKLLLARVSVLSGELKDARKLVNTLKKQTLKSGRITHWVQAKLIESHLLIVQDNLSMAEQSFIEAIKLGVPLGLRRTFIEFLPFMQPVIAILQPASETSLLLKSLTQESFQQVTSQVNPSTQCIKKLTKRESLVLRLLSEGHSNKEIANQLDLSPNTVKTYLKILFRKLAVRNRTEAANYYNQIA